MTAGEPLQSKKKKQKDKKPGAAASTLELAQANRLMLENQSEIAKLKKQLADERKDRQSDRDRLRALEKGSGDKSGRGKEAWRSSEGGQWQGRGTGRSCPASRLWVSVEAARHRMLCHSRLRRACRT